MAGWRSRTYCAGVCVPSSFASRARSRPRRAPPCTPPDAGNGRLHVVVGEGRRVEGQSAFSSCRRTARAPARGLTSTGAVAPRARARPGGPGGGAAYNLPPRARPRSVVRARVAASALRRGLGGPNRFATACFSRAPLALAPLSQRPLSLAHGLLDGFDEAVPLDAAGDLISWCRVALESRGCAPGVC